MTKGWPAPRPVIQDVYGACRYVVTEKMSTNLEETRQIITLAQ